MIDVAFTRADLKPAAVAVVVDVLRATSTATQALASGYSRVLCADSIERARELRGRGRVLAGERRCVKPPDFDQGNSPQEALVRRGEDLVLATTNGAPTIVAAARRAPRVLLASLLNLDAISRAFGAHSDRTLLDVQIVCSGTDGAVALEDVYVAGRLCSRLSGPRSDAAMVAESVARAFATPFDALAVSADARVLGELGLTGDIAYCAVESELDIVPVVIAAGEGVAAVANHDRDGEPAREMLSALPSLDADDTVAV